MYFKIQIEVLSMKENKYDDIDFFNEYKKMLRFVKGLEGAGEWHELEKMTPNFKDKDVLDLGVALGGTVDMLRSMEQTK